MDTFSDSVERLWKFVNGLISGPEFLEQEPFIANPDEELRRLEAEVAPTLEVVVDSPTIPAHGSTGFHAVLSGVGQAEDITLTISTSSGLSGSGTIHVEGDSVGDFSASASAGAATIDPKTGVGTFQAP